MKSLQWHKNTSSQNSVYPISREGHTLTWMNDKNKYALFGGMSTKRMEDVYFLDEEGKWDQIQTKGRSPRGRCYHQSWYEFPYLYLMGGEMEKH